MLKGEPITPTRLRYRDVPGAGKQIEAFVDQEVPCVEFTMKRDVFLPVVHRCSEPLLVFTEPFIQFSPDNWDDMQAQLFQQMVDAWNEKHGKPE